MTTADDLHVARELLMRELERRLSAIAAAELLHALERFIDAKIGVRFSPHRNDPAP